MKKEWWKLLEHYASEHFIEKSSAFEKLLELDFNELMINGWNEIYLERGSVIERMGRIFYSPEDYRKQLQHFLTKQNERLSVDKPIVDFDVGKNMRVSLINENLSQGEVVVTIRKRREFSLTEELLLETGFFTASQARFLKTCVIAKKTIFISGETSSGKTTLLNFLLQYVAKDERILIIEDTREIQVPQGYNKVFLRTREEEFQVKAISTSDLVKASLRMRPDRIILGEIRREEVVDFLHAISTGHRGSLSTGHGSDPRDMINRLEMLLLEAKVPLHAARGYLGHGIDVIVQLGGKKQRMISSINSVHYDRGEVVLKDAKSLSAKGDLSFFAEPADERLSMG